MKLTLTDPRHYTLDYPKTNILIDYALKILNNELSIIKLVEIIGEYLLKEEDTIINVAINLAPSNKVSRLIWEATNIAINQDKLTNDKNLLQINISDNNLESTFTSIFAIPLVLVAGSKNETIIKSQLPAEELNDFFLKKEIFHAKADSFISGKLVEASSITAIRPSQIYYWVRNLPNAKLWLPINLKADQMNLINEAVFLRFLIGVVRNPVDPLEDNINTAENEKGLNKDSQMLLNNSLNFNAFRSSSMELMKLIHSALGSKDIVLFPIPFEPVLLSDAFNIGDKYRKEVAIQVAISNIVRKIREHGVNARAKLSTENESIKLEVFVDEQQIKENTNLKLDELKETSMWNLNKIEDFEEIIMTLTNILKDMQVEYCYVN